MNTLYFTFVKVFSPLSPLERDKATCDVYISTIQQFDFLNERKAAGAG
jgi:hypothetical protein